MKTFYSGLIIMLIFSFGALTVFPCSCVLGDLSKRFKKANAVFIGKIYDYEKKEIPQIQNFRDDLPVMLVKKSWKGVEKEFIAINFEDFPKSSGTCHILYNFDEDKEYLVFAYGKDLKVEVQCSDTRVLKAEYDYTMKEIVQLDSLWFRFRSKLRF